MLLVDFDDVDYSDKVLLETLSCTQAPILFDRTEVTCQETRNAPQGKTLALPLLYVPCMVSSGGRGFASIFNSTSLQNLGCLVPQPDPSQYTSIWPYGVWYYTPYGLIYVVLLIKPVLGTYIQYIVVPWSPRIRKGVIAQ